MCQPSVRVERECRRLLPLGVCISRLSGRRGSVGGCHLWEYVSAVCQGGEGVQEVVTSGSMCQPSVRGERECRRVSPLRICISRLSGRRGRLEGCHLWEYVSRPSGRRGSVGGCHLWEYVPAVCQGGEGVQEVVTSGNMCQPSVRGERECRRLSPLGICVSRLSERSGSVGGCHLWDCV